MLMPLQTSWACGFHYGNAVVYRGENGHVMAAPEIDGDDHEGMVPVLFDKEEGRYHWIYADDLDRRIIKAPQEQSHNHNA